VRSTYKQVSCDNSKCSSVKTIPLTAENDYIPDYWIRTLMNSDEFVWETCYYDFCSIACLQAVKQNVDELIAAMNNEHDGWVIDHE
jgi:hypothetical protein